MRCFIAYRILDEDLEKVILFQDKLSQFRNVKIISKEQVHITASFLGEISESSTKDIIAGLDELSFKSIDLIADDFVVLPDSRMPRVFALKFQYNPEYFISLKQILQVLERNHELAKTLRKQKKDGLIHLTLARMKNLEQNALKSINEIKFSDFLLEDSLFRLREIVFFRSQLTPSAPVYSKLWSRKLGSQ
ncbi:RNA 2',3'-cyclic phosphodiesterase [Candidatus Woesearchaeota archaeon]|nr:RNA 2',3'-cyclic phosphodiesterase [Candidatus Woesearchaeota archaeon]